MLTPQEIQDQKFEKAMFGGYDMAQIDQFLDTVLNDYSSLYKENTALKAKMRVLVDKIEEYRAVDEELRKTLYNAQVAAKDTVTRAQCEADRILQSARSGASQHVTDLKEETARAEERLKIAKRNNLAYVEKIRRAMEQSIRQLEQVMELSSQPEQAAQPTAQPAAPPQPASMPAQPEPAPAPAQPAPAEDRPVTLPAPEEDARPVALDLEPPQPEEKSGPKSDTARIYGDSPFTPKPRFDFTDMRFGKNYENTEDNK